MEQYSSGLHWDSIYSNQHRQNAQFYQFTELAVKLLCELTARGILLLPTHDILMIKVITSPSIPY